jgi:hypothetical protein
MASLNSVVLVKELFPPSSLPALLYDKDQQTFAKISTSPLCFPDDEIH